MQYSKRQYSKPCLTLHNPQYSKPCLTLHNPQYSKPCSCYPRWLTFPPYSCCRPGKTGSHGGTEHHPLQGSHQGICLSHTLHRYQCWRWPASNMVIGFPLCSSTHLKVFFTEISFINHINLSSNNLVTDTANMAYCLGLYLNDFKDGKYIFHLKILFTDWLVFKSEISVA